MNELLEEAVRKLVASKQQYVRDALVMVGDQFEEMSDGGVDSLYAEPARQWRSLGMTVESLNAPSARDVEDEFTENDIGMIAAGVLWYELNVS